MKLGLLVLLVLLVTVARAETYFEYQNAGAGFAIAYPKTWSAIENANRSGVVLSDSAYKGVNKPGFSVTVSKTTAGVKLADYDRLVPKLFAFLFEDYKEYLKKATTLGGAPARMLLFQAKVAKTNAIGFMVYTIRGDKVYTAVFFSSSADYDRYRQVSGNVLGSFRFL